MVVMGDFWVDNVLMLEVLYIDFDEFNVNLILMEDQFFGFFYIVMYKLILSVNNVIENLEDVIEVVEVKFLRGLFYFKLVCVFGDVFVNLLVIFDVFDDLILECQVVVDVYVNVIIFDLEDVIVGLDVEIVNGRVLKYVVQGILGKVFV